MDIQEIPGYIQERVITIMKNYIGKITKIVTVEISQKKYNEYKTYSEIQSYTCCVILPDLRSMKNNHTYQYNTIIT